MLYISEKLQTVNVEYSDTAVIKRLLEGDEGAFEQVFKAFFKRLHAYACTILKDDPTAEEMVQNVFFNLWNKRARLTIEGSLKAYLYRAVHNESLNYLKHQKVKAAYQVHYTARADRGSAFPADGRLAAGELRANIRNALNELPPQCRAIFQLSRFEQLKYREIADELGISVKTVENQMGKALRLMRVKLAEFLPLLLIFLNLLR